MVRIREVQEGGMASAMRDLTSLQTVLVLDGRVGVVYKKEATLGGETRGETRLEKKRVMVWTCLREGP